MKIAPNPKGEATGTENRKAELLEAALRQFARYGYRRARVEDIAAELGLTKGAVYFYCAGKEALYRDSVEWALSSWCSSIERAVAGVSSAAERFVTLARRSFEYLSDNPDLRSVISADPSIYSLDPKEDRFAVVNDRARELLAATLRVGVASGEFRPELDVEKASRFLYQVYITFLIKAFALGEGDEAAALYEAGIDIAIMGLAARS
ncbi:MAG: TetR/AcrR family transcriptional regulator [Spirochaetes bacterium]|nr:TetR/AcrR family transcriptional regulator [Spirochaetota bacterium]MBU1081107.1 TetR/AcrR family transcriptional regulator [Spirochaetota bacterium]